MPNRRSRLSIVAPSASPEEAAAVAAAIERFLHDHAPPPVADAPGAPPWLRAALREGVSREGSELAAWGDADPWG